MSAITGILGAQGISIGTNLSSKKGEFHSWTLPLTESTNVTQPITYIPVEGEGGEGGEGTGNFLENSQGSGSLLNKRATQKNLDVS